MKVHEVGRDLGVRYVSKRGPRSGNRVRITAQLVDATTGFHIWAERYDRDTSDIFAVQDDVTRQIVRAMAVKLTEAEQTRMGRAPTGVLDAYDLVLRGNEERRQTTRESNAESAACWLKALDLDPDNATAYTGWAGRISRAGSSSGPPTARRSSGRKSWPERAIGARSHTGQCPHPLRGRSMWRKITSVPSRSSSVRSSWLRTCRRVRDARRDPGWSGTPEQRIRHVRHACG